jgi:hypothetical protein
MVIFVRRSRVSSAHIVAKNSLTLIADSGLDSNHNQSAKPEPVAISASCRLQDAICSNIDILFRGPILEDWLDNNNDNLPRKVPIMSWVSSASNAVMSPIDVPPMPPSIPNVSSNPTNPVKDPIPNLAKRLADTGALSSTTPAVPTRQRPPPIVVISAPRSSHVGSGNSRCFNSSPLKQSSLPSPATSSKSSPCSPELQTPPPSSSAALSEIGLMQSMWAPKD